MDQRRGRVGQRRDRVGQRRRTLLLTRAVNVSGRSTSPAIMGAAYCSTQGDPQVHVLEGSGLGAGVCTTKHKWSVMN